MPKTLKECAQDAIAVQDACNLSGVVRSYVEVLSTLRELFPSTRDHSTHPVSVMFAWKIQSLTSPECFCEACMASYSKAYDACKLLANPPAQTACEWMRQIGGLA